MAQSAAKFFAGWISELRPQLDHVLTDDETEIVGRYDVLQPGWPWASSVREEYRTLRTALRDWHEQVDPYSSHPRPELDTALLAVVSRLTGELRRLIKHERAVGGFIDETLTDRTALVDEDYYPRASPRILRAHGVNDRNYLDSLTRPGSELRNPRNYRIVRDRLSAYRPSIPSDEFHYGYDAAGHLVAITALDPVRCGGDFAVMAVLWPHEAPARGLPDNASLVGDARSGDRPVYVRYSDGELDLLPWKPGDDRGWNFGYSGTTPGNLALAIIRAYAMTHQIPTNRIPYHCVYEAVTHFRGAGLMLTAGDITRHVHRLESELQCRCGCVGRWSWG